MAQMLSRVETSHWVILAAEREGRRYTTPENTPSEIRGFQTARRTLLRWGCLEITSNLDNNQKFPVYRSRLTGRGLALLTALESRYKERHSRVA